MTKAYITIEREDASGTSREITLKVTGTHYEYVPARLHGHPDNSSPAEGGDTEIESVEVFVKKGSEPNLFAYLFTDNPELTDKEQEQAQEYLQTQAENDAEAAMEAAAEAAAEARYEDDSFCERDDY